LQDILPPKAYNAAKTLVLTLGVAMLSGILLLVLFYVMSSPTFGWTGTDSPPNYNAASQTVGT
jgi:dolichyl-diphosphooligosaccharide--protein glycosyltransferase